MADTNAVFQALKRRTESLIEQGKTESVNGIIMDDPNPDLEAMKRIHEQKERMRERKQYLEKGSSATKSPVSALNTTTKPDGVSRVAQRLASKSSMQEDFDEDGDFYSREVRRPSRRVAVPRGKRLDEGYNDFNAPSQELNEFLSHVQNMHGTAALKYAIRNLDEFLDDRGFLTEEAESGLNSLPKESLVEFIQVLMGTLR